MELELSPMANLDGWRRLSLSQQRARLPSVVRGILGLAVGVGTFSAGLLAYAVVMGFLAELGIGAMALTVAALLGLVLWVIAMFRVPRLLMTTLPAEIAARRRNRQQMDIKGLRLSAAGVQFTDSRGTELRAFDWTECALQWDRGKPIGVLPQASSEQRWCCPVAAGDIAPHLCAQISAWSMMGSDRQTLEQIAALPECPESDEAGLGPVAHALRPRLDAGHSFWLMVDATHPGVDVPHYLRRWFGERLLLQISGAALVGFRAAARGFTASCRFLGSGYSYRCSVPWEAVYAILDSEKHYFVKVAARLPQPGRSVAQPSSTPTVAAGYREFPVPEEFHGHYELDTQDLETQLRAVLRLETDLNELEQRRSATQAFVVCQWETLEVRAHELILAGEDREPIKVVGGGGDRIEVERTISQDLGLVQRRFELTLRGDALLLVGRWREEEREGRMELSFKRQRALHQGPS